MGASVRELPAKRDGKIWIFPLVLVGFAIIVPALLVPVFARAKIRSGPSPSLRSAKLLGTGLLLYASQNDDRLPGAVGWQDALKVTCSNGCLEELSDDRRQPFAFNELLATQRLAAISDPERTPMIFSKKLGSVAESGSMSLFRPTSSSLRSYIVWADGSARSARRPEDEDFSKFHWKPSFALESKKIH